MSKSAFSRCKSTSPGTSKVTVRHLKRYFVLEREQNTNEFFGTQRVTKKQIKQIKFIFQVWASSLVDFCFGGVVKQTSQTTYRVYVSKIQESQP